MNRQKRQKNKLTKAIVYFSILFLGLITVSTTASAWALFDWLYGDSLMWIAIILGCAVVLVIIGGLIYLKFKGQGLSMLIPK